MQYFEALQLTRFDGFDVQGLSIERERITKYSIKM